ncbi:DUF899 domain-containing protein [Dyella solisilvae]|uniref:DUF899 domain-containing protein n=1 Tax=Dyella solisilvae TaxID=1920168 RepID=A0A370K6C7_9GAMM|nr:DUF899 domain-containing protein [Dyella solisilvae]RDI98017.1 DUF899 domain-containing protein [Dyella solisilvae]
MTHHHIVNHEQWLEARTRFLAKEKEFTHLRDELSRQRRELPWERVEKSYVFDSEHGKETLADLFGKHNQLIVYHFMYAPDWDIGCKHCSFWADNFNGIIPHLNQRDVSMVAISRAPLAKLKEQAREFGWTFKWVSSADGDFNYDYNVSFSPEALAQGGAPYNYGTQQATRSDLPGISAFIRVGDQIFHTYSTYGRGVDMLNTAYHYLDLAPKGRDEQDLPFPMAWVKHRIAYES